MQEFNQLLRLAIKARQTVRATTDPTESPDNIALILRWYSGATMLNKETPATVHKYSHEENFSEGATVLLNEEDNYPHVGELTPPKSMVVWKIRQYSGQPGRYTDLVRGLSLARIDYLFQMASAMKGKITTANIRLLLDIMETGGGLDKVQLLPPYYVPHPKVIEIAAQAKSVQGNPELMLSGIMFTGESGTGKTSAATYIAEKLALPAYRLDLTSTLNKYYGQSENRLRESLAKIDAASPCVVLFDEVEKVLGGDDDSLLRRMLSTLLWWLENKPAGVLPIMTCNANESIPAELYRQGRIDAKVELKRNVGHAAAVAQAFTGYLHTQGHKKVWKPGKQSLKGTPTDILGEIRTWYREHEPKP